jgi:hypothetical protein
MAFAVKLANATTGSHGWAARFSYIYYLLNPASGSHNVVINCTNNHYLIAVAADYTGVQQSGQAQGTGTNISSTSADVTSLTTNLTVGASYCWVMSQAYPGTDSGTNATVRLRGGAFAIPTYYDSNGPLPAGSTDISITVGAPGSNPVTLICAAFVADASFAYDIAPQFPAKRKYPSPSFLESQRQASSPLAPPVITRGGFYEQGPSVRWPRTLPEKVDFDWGIATSAVTPSQFSFDIQPPPPRRPNRPRQTDFGFGTAQSAVTPSQFGFEGVIPTRGRERARAQRLDYDVIPVPAPPTPTQFGAELPTPLARTRMRPARLDYELSPPAPPQFAAEAPAQISRGRPRPSRLDYDPGYEPPPPTPTQFGAEAFLPSRGREKARPARLDYDVMPVPVAPTPTQFGTETPTQIARTRARPARLEYDPGYEPPPATPTQFGLEGLLPTRARERARPARLDYDAIPVPVAETPTQFGAELADTDRSHQGAPGAVGI